MIIFDGLDLIVLAVGVTLLAICGVILAVERISSALKKRRKK